MSRQPRELRARLDDEGFLLDPREWTTEVASVMAERRGIGPLHEEHWRIIACLRRRYHQDHGVPLMRQVCHDLDTDERCVSELFGDPLSAWRIAGLPNPGEEAKSYLPTSEVARHGT